MMADLHDMGCEITVIDLRQRAVPTGRFNVTAQHDVRPSVLDEQRSRDVVVP